VLKPVGGCRPFPRGYNGSAYSYTKTSYRWAGNTLVRQVDTDHGGFATVADGLPGMTSDQGRDQLPTEFTTRCGGGSW
jgi:hypothetical protein